MYEKALFAAIISTYVYWYQLYKFDIQTNERGFTTLRFWR